MSSAVVTLKPTIQFIQRTETERQTSEIQYSQADIQYSSGTVVYGGVGVSLSPAPTNILVFQPVNSAGTIVLQAGQPIGPGFFMFIPYVTAATITP